MLPAASASRVVTRAVIYRVQGADKGAAAGYKKEAEEFGKLGMTSVSESLRGIFFGHQKCTKNPFGKPSTPVDVCQGRAALLQAKLAWRGHALTRVLRPLVGSSLVHRPWRCWALA